MYRITFIWKKRELASAVYSTEEPLEALRQARKRQELMAKVMTKASRQDDKRAKTITPGEIELRLETYSAQLELPLGGE